MWFDRWGPDEFPQPAALPRHNGASRAVAIMTVQASLVRPKVRRRPQQPAELLRNQATREYFLRATATADPIAKARILDKIITANLPVADRLAMRYSGRGISTPDLVQVARLGLVQAVRRFEPKAESEFLSFAIPTMLGELKRHFRDRGWAVRPTRRIQELQPRVLAAAADLTQEFARTPTRTEIADYLDVDESAVVEAQVAVSCFTAASLDQPVVNDSRTTVTWAYFMGHEDPALEWAEFRLTLAPLFRRLSDRDRLVLHLRLVDDLTQKQIGGIVGITQTQVSRILTRIMRLARDELAA